MKKLLPCGVEIQYDEADAAVVDSLTWYDGQPNGRHHIINASWGRTVSLGRLLVGADDVGSGRRVQVRHVNGDKLDFRRGNLTMRLFHEPNAVRVEGADVWVDVGHGLEAVVDFADWGGGLANYRWYASKMYSVRNGVQSPTKHWRVIAGVRDGRGKQRTVYLHREVAGDVAGKVLDHIDGDTLNNRRGNLRHVVGFQNNANKAKRRDACSSRFKGVCRRKDGRWVAYIQKGGVRRSLGAFGDEGDAARAYDAAAVELFGEYACLNFPVGGGRSAAIPAK